MRIPYYMDQTRSRFESQLRVLEIQFLKVSFYDY